MLQRLVHQAILLLCALSAATASTENAWYSVMRPSQYSQWYLRSSQPAPSSVHTSSPVSNVLAHGRPAPLIVIPGFQDTVLERCEHNVCKPVFLAPLTPRTWQTTYQSLRNRSSVRVFSELSHTRVETPCTQCIPAPSMHIGHCTRVPSRGPYSDLFKSMLRIDMGYEHNATLFVLGWDWRDSPVKAAREKNGRTLRTLLKRANNATVLAFGSGCAFAAYVLHDAKKTNTLLCARGNEHDLEHGDAHLVYSSGGVPAAANFDAVEAQVGLRAGRKRRLPNSDFGVFAHAAQAYTPLRDRTELGASWKTTTERRVTLRKHVICDTRACAKWLAGNIHFLDSDNSTAASLPHACTRNLTHVAVQLFKAVG